MSLFCTLLVGYSAEFGPCLIKKWLLFIFGYRISYVKFRGLVTSLGFRVYAHMKLKWCY